jgi:hypothetical protein
MAAAPPQAHGCKAVSVWWLTYRGNLTSCNGDGAPTFRLAATMHPKAQAPSRHPDSTDPPET